jgi:hypothetical protein
MVLFCRTFGSNNVFVFASRELFPVELGQFIFFEKKGWIKEWRNNAD